MTAAAPQFDAVLLIGAGKGEEVQGWLDSGTKRIMLIEPNPACTPALTQLCAGSDRVEHIEAAVAGQDGEALLRVFNLSRHSSLRSPSALMDLLPGLRQVSLVPVATVSVTSLLDRLGAVEGAFLLVLDAPGTELDILQSFKQAGALERLNGLDLICAEEPLYHGAVGRPALQAWVEDAGFVITALDDSDPDWPRLSFRIDQNARKIAALTAELAELQDAQTASEGLILALKSQLTKVETASEASAAASAEEIASLKALLVKTQLEQSTLASELAQSQEARQVADDALASAIRDHERATAAHGADFATLSAERDGLADLLKASTAQVSDLAARLDDRDKAVSRHLADLEAQSRTAETAHALAEGLAARVAELDLAVSDLAQRLEAAHLREQTALQETANLRAKLDAAAADRATFEQDGQRLAAEVAAQNATIAELTEKAAQGAKALEETKALSATRHQRMKDLEAELKTKVIALAEAGTNLERALIDLDTAKTGLASMTQALEAGAQRIGILEGDLSEAGSELNSRTIRLAELESLAKDLTVRADDARVQIEKFETTLAETRSTLATRTAEKAAAEARIGAQAKQMADLEAAVQAAQSDAAAKAETLGKQVAWTKELEIWLDQSRVQNGADLARIAETEGRIRDQDATILAAETRCTELEGLLTSARATHASQTETLALATLQINELRERQSDLETKLAVTVAESSKVAEMAAVQAERIKELEFRRELVRDELRRSEGQLNLIKDLLLRGDRL